MIYILILLSLIILVLGVLILIVWVLQKKKFGVLNHEKIYQDSEKIPGEVLISKKINLAGKPDYIIKQNGIFIPVEVKTGRTPKEPYENHTMQLMAYCFLVEEKYAIKPPGGYLKYPEKEFHIAYTDLAKKAIIAVVKEILENKKLNREFPCKHPEHNR